MSLNSERVWADFNAQLRNWLRQRIDDEHAVDDVLQEIFLRMHRALPQLKVAERVGPWLYRIARNALNDHFRKKNPQPVDNIEIPDEPNADTAKGDIALWLLAMTQNLPEHYRQAIELVEIQGLTQQEAATQLGLSLSGVKSRVQRARSKLRELLDACCHVTVDGRGQPVHWTPKSREGDCACD